MGNQPDRNETTDSGEEWIRSRYPLPNPLAVIVISSKVVVFHPTKGAYQFVEEMRYYPTVLQPSDLKNSIKKMMRRRIVDRIDKADMLFGWTVGEYLEDEYLSSDTVRYPEKSEPQKLF